MKRAAIVALTVVTACASEHAPRPEPDAGASLPSLTRAELLDPLQCKSCHPNHYREWASSMHAYSSQDPVFLAMNRRGQRETQGALGDFCVRCHAPMAVREGRTTDGLNLDEVPAELRGVTCYFCHNATGAEQAFNNHLTLADDDSMRGGIHVPLASSAHRAEYSAFHDRNQAASSSMCGSCHDVVNRHGVKLERTFLEYQESLFGKAGPGFETCGGCHMPGKPGQAAEGADLPTRTVHEHLWPGVDLALSDFPDREAQRRAVECALGLNTRFYSITLSALGELVVKVETSAGHHQPSGPAFDRRLWLEVIAYDKNGAVLFASGTIADGELEEKAPGTPGYDSQLVLFRDWLYDAEGQLTHDFWNAAASTSYGDGFASLTLPAAQQLGTAHTLDARYTLLDAARIVHVCLRLRMRPGGLDVLKDLVASGDLDAAVLPQMPTFSLQGASVTWRPDDGSMTPLLLAAPECPDAYVCLLKPNDGSCSKAH
ncbi:MAG: cytochrome c family protein [Myxococcaceae bacterium]|nr:cytochrome c family protein [Myxococcaceae bacterium]